VVKYTVKISLSCHDNNQHSTQPGLLKVQPVYNTIPEPPKPTGTQILCPGMKLVYIPAVENHLHGHLEPVSRRVETTLTWTEPLIQSVNV